MICLLRLLRQALLLAPDLQGLLVVREGVRVLALAVESFADETLRLTHLYAWRGRKCRFWDAFSYGVMKFWSVLICVLGRRGRAGLCFRLLPPKTPPLKTPYSRYENSNSKTPTLCAPLQVLPRRPDDRPRERSAESATLFRCTSRLLRSCSWSSARDRFRCTWTEHGAEQGLANGRLAESA